jgi:hypothetical protein
MTPKPDAPRPTVNEDAVWDHLRAALNRETPLTIWTAIADIPVLLAELERLRSLLTWARTEFANLLAAARATLAATDEGEPDPLSYLRDEAARHRPNGDPGGTGR